MLTFDFKLQPGTLCPLFSRFTHRCFIFFFQLFSFPCKFEFNISMAVQLSDVRHMVYRTWVYQLTIFDFQKIFVELTET